MGFRNGAYATIWEVQPKTPNVTVLRITTSKKPKGQDNYVTDFSGFCSCLGQTSAEAAKGLQRGDRIKLGEVETLTTYIKEKDKTYTNFNIYSFERVASGTQQSKQDVYEGVTEVEGDEDEGIPF